MQKKRSAKEAVNAEIALGKLSAAQHTHRTESRRLIDRINELERDLHLLEAISTHRTRRTNISAPRSKEKSVATAVIQWSDWHVDEVVKRRTVNGLNEYNPDIARQRATKLFENGLKVVNTQRHDVDIKTLVIHLGGDFIGGYIHDELQQTNSMSPLEGIFFAKDLIISGLEYYLKGGGFDRIVCVCSRGNHGRMTKKMQFANDYSMNLESFLYHAIAKHFESRSGIEFVIEDGEITYVDVYGQKLRFFHGHQVKYRGGVGGLTVPLYKQIFRWNANVAASYNFMCDKHTYSMPTPDCQVNGSLKGYDAYAAGHGFLFQEPLQSFTLIDAKRGITIRTKIYCE